MLDGEATVKRLRREDGHVWLMPHNRADVPIPGDDAVILGRDRAEIHSVGERVRRSCRAGGPFEALVQQHLDHRRRQSRRHLDLAL
ncbi:LexA family protein [Streptomyces roseofulvus]|uniref:LexA family protein n=1 Tax=Streptomyces TaxID=1883 RepID=UPI0035EB74F5